MLSEGMIKQLQAYTDSGVIARMEAGVSDFLDRHPETLELLCLGLFRVRKFFGESAVVDIEVDREGERLDVSVQWPGSPADGHKALYDFDEEYNSVCPQRGRVSFHYHLTGVGVPLPPRDPTKDPHVGDVVRAVAATPRFHVGQFASGEVYAVVDNLVAVLWNAGTEIIWMPRSAWCKTDAWISRWEVLHVGN